MHKMNRTSPFPANCTVNSAFVLAQNQWACCGDIPCDVTIHDGICNHCPSHHNRCVQETGIHAVWAAGMSLWLNPLLDVIQVEFFSPQISYYVYSWLTLHLYYRIYIPTCWVYWLFVVKKDWKTTILYLPDYATDVEYFSSHSLLRFSVAEWSSCVHIPALFLYFYRPCSVCGSFFKKKSRTLCGWVSASLV